MASKTENVKLGVCRITFDGNDLGLTKGGVEVDVTTNTHAVSIDQFGESVVNEYITKRSIKVKAPLAETTLDNLNIIMPGSSIVVNSSDPTKRRADVKNGIGKNLKKVAKSLKLHPVEVKDPLDDSEDLIIPLAATAGAMNFSFKHDQERIFNTEFNGYPNPITKILFTLGNLVVGASNQILTDINGQTLTDINGQTLTVLP